MGLWQIQIQIQNVYFLIITRYNMIISAMENAAPVTDASGIPVPEGRSFDANPEFIPGWLVTAPCRVPARRGAARTGAATEVNTAAYPDSSSLRFGEKGTPSWGREVARRGFPARRGGSRQARPPKLTQRLIRTLRLSASERRGPHPGVERCLAPPPTAARHSRDVNTMNNFFSKP